MAFWGVEIKAGKPFTLTPDKSFGRLRISQATLGFGSSNNKCLVQCNVGKKTPVMLCCLLPEKAETCHLELEFEEAEEVTFSVVGPRAVYLTGYFLGNTRRILAGDDESESFGEDVGVTDSEEFSNDEDYEQDSFIDDNDDPELVSPSPSSSYETNKMKTGTKKKSRKRLKKKYELSESEDDGGISSKKTKNVLVVETDEEDQMPISSFSGIAKLGDGDSKRKKHALSGNTTDDDQCKDKKVKKRKINNENGTSLETAKPVTVAKSETDSVEAGGGKKRRARTLAGGLIVEDLKAGDEDGKVASSGNKVTVHYTGSLKEGGQIFDSTAGKDPLKFRLGKGRVMDGLDQGIEGMRVGGKRRLQIPPALGYGSEGSTRVPPSSWLIMDVELLRVR